MIDKKLNLIDKEYLEDTIINLDKEFLSKKYYLKKNGENLKNLIIKIIGEEKFQEFEENTYDNGFVKELIDDEKTTKYFINEEELPNPNDADEKGYYIILDKNSIDEKCKFFVYTIINQNNVKTWAVISSPSVLFEVNNLDFDKEFVKYKRKDEYSNLYSYYNWEEFRKDIVKNDMKYVSINGNNLYGYEGIFQSNKEYNYELLKIFYYNSRNRIYIKGENEEQYNLYDDDKNVLAQKIINLNSLGEENGRED